MNRTSPEAILRRLQQMQSEMTALTSDIFHAGLDRQLVSSLFAHFGHAGYAIGYAETLITRALREAAEGTAAAELEQVNGRA